MAKFITHEIREESGKCSPVNDAIMQNVGIERMGNCWACGHEIKMHYGILSPKFGYQYVGACCKKILCSPDKVEIVPDSPCQFINSKGNERVYISKDFMRKIAYLAYGQDQYDRFLQNGYTSNGGLWIKNRFAADLHMQLCSIYSDNTLSVKQFAAINKILES